MDNRSYIVSNDAERARLQSLVERLSDDDLYRPIRDGWTVSALLAHLAFLDRLRLEGWELQLQTSERLTFFETSDEINIINAASLPAMLAIPPREAARQALEAAEAIDWRLRDVPPELVELYLSSNTDHDHRMLYRSVHRRMHLDEIEAELSGRRTNDR